MLDFAFGPNGYGLTEGMRKEQDRITQNRSAFANNMATFLANNPYISPEAAQAFINSAAGTDNTLRGSVPNQLIGELNKENTRKRRIDTFQAFNEFTRLNPGATAAEFQSAMSALGAQGVYGADALKAIQGRSDQYRKDQETKRMFDQAQNVGQLRTQLMTDAKSIFMRNGFDVEKTKKELQSIYGNNMPVPLDTIVNPGMATSLQTDIMREYLPKAVDILGRNPNMTPEMLYGVFPELQGSPVLKGIYDAAQKERKKAVEDKFYSSKKQIVDATASSILLGTDPFKAYEEAARSAGMRPEDMAAVDGNSILAEAQALAKKSKDDQQQKLDASLSGAKGKMYESLRTNTLADPLTLQTLANGDITAVESFVRARIRDESGLTEAEIAKIPDSYYRSLAVSIQGQLATRAKMEQAKVYDEVRAQGPAVLKGLREQNMEIAKAYESDSVQAAIKNAGLDTTVSGAAIPTLMKTFAETYDLSNGGAAALFSNLMEAAKNNPDAGMAIGTEAIKASGLKPLGATVNEKVEALAWEQGAVSRSPLPATTFVSNEKAKLSKGVEGQIAAIQQKLTSVADPEKMLADLTSFRNQLLQQSAQTQDHYASALITADRWSAYNDRFTEAQLKDILDHSGAETQRLLGIVDRAMSDMATRLAKQKQQTSAPANVLGPPVGPQNSPFYNNVIAPIAPTTERAEMRDLRRQLLQAMPAVPNSNTPVIGPVIDMLNPSNFFNSQADVDLTEQMAQIANSPEAMTVLYQNPDIWALIDPKSEKRNPQQFIKAMQERGFLNPAPQQ